MTGISRLVFARMAAATNTGKIDLDGMIGGGKQFFRHPLATGQTCARVDRGRIGEVNCVQRDKVICVELGAIRGDCFS
jgi:hypothetical protein